MTEAEAYAAGYRSACRIDALDVGRPTLVVTELGRAVLLRVTPDDPLDVAAFTPMCPHQMADLASGAFERGQIECPLHSYRFDVRTGACAWPSDGPTLRTYPVQLIAGRAWVKIDRPRWMSSAD